MDELEIMVVEVRKRIGLDDEYVYEIGNDGFEFVRRRIVFDFVEGKLNEAVAGLDTVDGLEKVAADVGSFGADVEVIEKEGFEFRNL